MFSDGAWLWLTWLQNSVGDGKSKKNHPSDVKKRRKRMKLVNTSTDIDVLNLQDNVSVMVIFIFICKFIFLNLFFS